MGKNDVAATVEKVVKQKFEAVLYIDLFNERIRVDDYYGDRKALLLYIGKIAAQKQVSKIILFSKEGDWGFFLENGYIVEARFPGYYNGNTAVAMVYYFTDERRTSRFHIKEDKIIQSILKLEKLPSLQRLPASCLIREADVTDAKALATLYESVFSIYPTPLHDEQYVKDTMTKGTVYMIVEENQLIVSAASADVSSLFRHAELTDCATLPSYRKNGLMKILLSALEKRMAQSNVFQLFSIARSLSFGMNAAFYQLGYTYNGRLINNCYIFDKLEDMNVWTKNLACLTAAGDE